MGYVEMSSTHHAKSWLLINLINLINRYVQVTILGKVTRWIFWIYYGSKVILQKVALVFFKVFFYEN